MQVLRREIINAFPLQGNAAYSAAGIAQIQLGFCPAGYNIEIERLVVNAVSGTRFDLYAYDSSNSLNIREHAGSPLLSADPIQIADEHSPVRFWPNEAILAVFSGGTPGNVASVYGQAWVVLYNPVELPKDETGVHTSGLHEVGPSDAPDPGGWN